MKQLLHGLRKRGRALLCVILAAAVVTGGLCADSFLIFANGTSKSFDLGVNPDSVIATLEENGLLSVTGSGEIRDFTPDTAPFAQERVLSVKIGPDITALGAYTFYNCATLTDTVELGVGLVRLGDGAFAGDTPETAPAPAYVKNLFTQALVTRRRAEEESQPSAEAGSSDMEETEKIEDAEDTGETVREARLPLGFLRLPGAGLALDVTDGVVSAVSEALAGEEPEPAPEEEPEPTEDAEPTREPEPDAEPEPTQEPEPTEGPAPTETPAPTEETVPTEEPSPSAAPEESRFVIEQVHQQELGKGLFVSGQRGAFLCSEENESFRTALKAAGFAEAKTSLVAVFSCGQGSSSSEEALQKELPIVDGSITLPICLAEFSAPASDNWFAYLFSGWTETQDEAGVIHSAGERFSVAQRGSLYFIANWSRKLLASLTLTGEEGGLRAALPQPEGWQYGDCRWQRYVLSEGEEIPVEQDLLAWEDLPGETGESVLVPEDENTLLRCVAAAAMEGAQETLTFGAVRCTAPAAKARRRALTAGEDNVFSLAPAHGLGVQSQSYVIGLPAGSGYALGLSQDGEFHWAAPTAEENGWSWALPEDSQAERTYGLRVDSDTAGLHGVFVTENGAPVYQADTAPQDTGDAQVLTLTFWYDSSARSFAGGSAILTLTYTDAQGQAASLSVTVAIQGNQALDSQSVAVVAGRSFEEITGATAVAIAPQGAVTALFQTAYTPVVTGAAEQYLTLCALQNETWSAVSFPSGARVVLGDLTSAIGHAYYPKDVGGLTKVSLAAFGYAGYPAGQKLEPEKLLAALDLSGSALETGSYALVLTHDRGAAPETLAAQGARFSVGDGGGNLTVQALESTGDRWSFRVRADASAADTRYASGAAVKLTLTREGGGDIVALPSTASLACSADAAPVKSPSGGYSMALPVGTDATLTLDLSQVQAATIPDGRYQVNLTMTPRVGLQLGCESANDASAAVVFALRRDGAGARSVYLDLSDSAKRLVDASQGPVTLALRLQCTPAQGDSLSLRVLEKRNGEYFESTDDWALTDPAAALESGEVSLTVAQGRARGTYRVLAELVNDGVTVASHPYNFIVK